MHSAAFSKDSSGSYTTSAAAFFCCDKESVTELVLKSRTHGEVRAMVIGIRETNTHFIVQYEKEFCFLCLVLGPESSGQEGLQICHKWLEQLQKGSPQVSAKSLNSYCLLSHFRRLNELDLSSSDRNLSLVYLVKAEPITVKIIHCLDTFTEKTYYIECNDTCSVREVKQQFLQLYRQEQHVAVDVGSVWFTLGDKVLPDDRALKWREQAIRFDDEDSMDLVHILPENTFYIHFQPANAVPVKVHFRSVARRNTQLKSERLLIISPTATADDLRLEIAKIIHKDPFSCKLFISGKKIEADNNLEDLLSGSSCTVVVEQRDKISLTVDTTSQRVSVQMHKYESVAKLKAEVCNTLQVPLYTVDLKHSNTNLQEQQNLRTSRLRDSDTVQAVLLPHRMRVRVRLSSGHWEDIVVDNQTVSTVGHLKGFAQHLIQQQLSASSRDELGGLSTLIEYNVIFNGCVLCDDNTLKDAGVTMNSKIVLVQTEKHCFTAGWGRVPIFLSEANGVLRREFVMSDGKVFYFGPQFFSQPRECGSAAEPSRSPIIFHNDNTKQSTEGLHLCPQNLKTQFPPDYQRPQTSSPEQRQYVCTICKSSSIPSFRTQDNTDAESDLARSRSEVLSNTMPPTEDMSYKGCSHAQNGSCVLKQAENSSLTFQTFQKDVANKTSTPGKEPAGEDFGVASLPVCSISNIFNPHNQSTAPSGLDTASQAQAQMSQNLTEGGCTAQTVVQPDSRADENGNPTGNISSTQAVLTYQPGTPVTTQRSISSGYVSEYESTDRWKAYKRKVSFVESVKRAPEGHLICTKTFKSEQNVDPESAQFFVPNPTGSITYPGLGTAFEHAMIPASADFTYLDPFICCRHQ